MNLTEIYFRKKKKQLECITHYSVLYVALFITVVLILSMFYFAILQKRILDPEVPMNSIAKERISQLADVQVETGIAVHDFSQFEMLKNHFAAQATVWFYFDPAKVDKGLVDQFVFERGLIKSKSAPREIKHGDKLMVLYDIELEFQGSLDYSHFPLDRHRLDLILVNPYANTQQLLYVTNKDAVQIDNDAATPGWSSIGTSSKYGVAQEQFALEENPLSIAYEKTVFSLFFEHTTLKEATIIFVPLLLMFLVGLLSLLVDMVSESSVIIELAVGSTLALVFYSMYMRSFIPKTGIFTLVDAFYVLLTLFTSIIFLMQIFILHYYRKKQEVIHLKEVLDYTLSTLTIFRSGMFLFTLFVFILTVFYMLILR